MCFVGIMYLEVVGSAAGVVCRAWGVAQSFVGRVLVSVDRPRCCFNQVSSFFVEFGSTDKCKSVSTIQHLTSLRAASICLSQCLSTGSTRTALAREEIYDLLFSKADPTGRVV
jgi:hypothetical protein